VVTRRPRREAGGKDPSATQSRVEVSEPTTDPGQPAMMTRFATRSALVAESVQKDLGDKRYGGRAGRCLRVAEPDGPSTDGGLKARQAILLVPARGEGAALVCGWLDAARMTAQLRSWEAVRRKHAARFGLDPELGQRAYDTFLADVRRALAGDGLDVQLVVPDDEPLPLASPPPASGLALPGAVALGVGALLLGLLLGRLL
jgi:hypothetical protein